MDVPEGHYEEGQMKQTVVPNRNAIFASILYGLSHFRVHGNMTQNVIVALGVHSGDHEIYPDCRPEFYTALERAFSIGNWSSENIQFYLPYIQGDKQTIRGFGQKSKTLKLGFRYCLQKYKHIIQSR